MKNYFQTHPFSKTGMLAIPLLLFTLLMGQFFPKEAPEGFSSFIIAFEFAQTPADLEQLLGNLSAKAIHKIDVGNYLDFGFMLTYTTLLILSFLNFSKERNKKWLKLGVIPAIIVLLGDFTENIFLLRLTDNYLSAAPDEIVLLNLTRLHISTWIKWGSLSVCFALIASLFFNMKWYNKVTGIVFLLPLLLLMTMMDHRPYMLSFYTNSIFLCFILLTVYLFVFRKEHKKS